MSTDNEDQRPTLDQSPPLPEEKALDLDRRGMVVMPTEPVEPIVIQDMVGGLPPVGSDESGPATASGPVPEPGE